MSDAPSGYFEEVGSAGSCFLNALLGGPRRVTFSAWSWHLTRQGSRASRIYGWVRVCVVDALNWLFALVVLRKPRWGHCREAYESHVARGLLARR